jgi:hypothetical protein
MFTATEVVSVRQGRITSMSPNAAGSTNEVVSYNGDKRPLKVGDKVEPDPAAPGDYQRLGDGLG